MYSDIDLQFTTYLDNMAVTAKMSCKVLFCNVGGQSIQPYTSGGHTFSKPQLIQNAMKKKVYSNYLTVFLLLVMK